MSDRDGVRRFLFEHFAVRGEVVGLDATWRAVLARHNYPDPVRIVLGEAMAAAALMASTLKFDGTLTLQIQASGPMHLVVVQCTHRYALRGLARWDGELPDAGLEALTGGGRLTITVESGARQQRFQGIVPLEGNTIADCVQSYFDTSLQVPTRLWLATGSERVAGLLLQRLPSPGAAQTNQPPTDDDDWRRVGLLAGTLAPDELLGLDDRDLLHRLYHEDDLRVFEPHPVSFRCTCSRQRVESALTSMGRDEVVAIVAEQGDVETTCEFCNRTYTFDRVDIEALFADEAGVSTPPSRLH